MHVKQSVNYFANWFLLTRFLWVKKSSKNYVFFQWLCKTIDQQTICPNDSIFWKIPFFLSIYGWIGDKHTLYIESMSQSWKKYAISNNEGVFINFELLQYKGNRWKTQGFEFLNHVESVIRNKRFSVHGTSDDWHMQCHPILFFLDSWFF